MKQDTQNSMKRVSVNVDQTQAFVIINQRQNGGKCRCECKELIGKGACDEGFIWNPSSFECECDKSRDAGEYLDYESCRWRKRLANKLVEVCTENIDEVKIASKNKHNKCSSSTLYIVLFSMTFTINIGIATYFVYYKYMNLNEENASWYNHVYQAKNY